MTVIRSSTFTTIISVTFVFLWSTGYVGAKWVLPYVEPLTFLLWRFVGVCTILLLPAALATGQWPRDINSYCHLAIAGLCNHAVYLGGVFIAVKAGMSAGDVAMIVNLQPLLMVLIAALMWQEHMIARQWIGFALGWIGVVLVVQRNATGESIGAHLASPAMLAAVVALIGIAFGTLYQRRFCSKIDLRVANLVQYLCCAVVYAVIAPQFESMKIDWNWRLIVGYGWFVVVLSIGAISLLYWLLRQGLTSEVAKLFFLVPPCTAVLAWLLFDERLGWIGVAGMVCVAIAVVLARPAVQVVKAPESANR
jgi:drug/metabolite transporter (DMT)-like permease